MSNAIVDDASQVEVGATASDVLAKSWAENRSLRTATLMLVGLLGLSIIGLVVDDRVLLGDPVWLKPAKFAFSSAVYAVSMMMVLTAITGRERLVRNVSAVTAVTLLIEVLLISMQAGRGVRSHFNFATMFDAVVFAIMGWSILALWIASVFAVVGMFKQKFEHPAWGTLLRWALLITVVGSGLGGAMMTPRSDQPIGIGGEIPGREIGAHSVGVADGGDGLAIVGWSSEGGDLRIGHFFGLHALQVLPFAGVGILRLARRRSMSQQVGLMHVISAGYLAGVIVLTLQAMRGESLLHPGWLTLTICGVLVAALACAGRIVLTPSESNGSIFASTEVGE